MTEVQLNIKFFVFWSILAILAAVSSCGAGEPKPAAASEAGLRVEIQSMLRGEHEDRSVLVSEMAKIPWAETLEILVAEVKSRQGEAEPISKPRILHAYQRHSLVNRELRLEDAERRLEEETARHKAAVESLRAAIESAIAEEQSSG